MKYRRVVLGYTALLSTAAIETSKKLKLAKQNRTKDLDREMRHEPPLPRTPNRPIEGIRRLRFVMGTCPPAAQYTSVKPLSPTTTLEIALVLALTGCARSDFSDAETESPTLISVAERGDLSALDALLKSGPSPDVRDSCEWTPLMKAAQNGHIEAVDLLLGAGAAVDSEDKGGYTSMMLAASNNHSGIVGRLLGKGASINHRERTRGWTALIWAAKQGHTETVEVLLRHGADRTLKDFDGRTAADWAQQAAHVKALALLQPARHP